MSFIILDPNLDERFAFALKCLQKGCVWNSGVAHLLWLLTAWQLRSLENAVQSKDALHVEGSDKDHQQA